MTARVARQLAFVALAATCGCGKEAPAPLSGTTSPEPAGTTSPASIGPPAVRPTVDDADASTHAMRGRALGWVGEIAADGERLANAIAHYEAALAPGVRGPLAPVDRATTQAELGLALLNRQDADETGLARARDLLREAVAFGLRRDQAVKTRYNLACAHARLKELDSAFEHLTRTLDQIADEPVSDLGERWRDDTDFAALRGDPRWGNLLRAHPSPPR